MRKKSELVSTDPPSDMSFISEEEVVENYHQYLWKKVLFILICIVVSVVVAGYAMTIGSYDIGFFECYRIIFDHIVGNPPVDKLTETKDYVIWTIRMPRVLAGIIAGVGLACAGAVMQSCMKNPLADPYTTGISSGASFGATIAMISGITIVSGEFSTVLNAFVFSLVPTAAIVAISAVKRASPTTIILAGIAIMYIFNAMTTLLMLMADPNDMAEVYSWQVGSLGITTWGDVPIMAVVTIIGFGIMWALSGKINVLTSGDENAKTLGIDADRLRILCLVVVSLVAAAIVSFTGIIGFVGLVCPHVARMFIGSDNRYLLPASAAFGVAMLLIADLIGRTIIAPAVLQVGVITAFIGGPMLIYLLIKQKKEVW